MALIPLAFDDRERVMDIGSAIAFLSCVWLLTGMIPLQRKLTAAAVRTRQHRARR